MFSDLWQGLRQLLYPNICLSCKKPLKDIGGIDGLICDQCWSAIKINPPPFCAQCGRHLNQDEFKNSLCRNCQNTPLYFDRAYSPCVYDGIIKDLIHEFKYKNKDYLGLTLSRPMIEFGREYNLPFDYIDLIIPIPLHERRLREREFNQAQILSNHIGSEFNKEVSSAILRRSRYTKSQTELEKNERHFNVKDSFSLFDSACLRHKNILLIDDVLTSGATCSEAAYTLKDAGAGMVFVLTLAD